MQNIKKTADIQLGSGNVQSLMLRLAIPTVIAQLVNMLYNIVDRMYIGHIANTGTVALSGVGLCFPVIMLISAFAALGGAGGAPLAAIEMGKGDMKKAEKILGNCLTTLVVFALMLTVVFLLTGRSLLQLFGASADNLSFGWDYLKIYVCGSLFVMLVLGLNPFITAQGFSKVSMTTTLIGAVLNIILDPVFIFVFKMGVQGAALASVLSQAVGALWVLRFLLGRQSKLRLQAGNLCLDAQVIVPCLSLGMSGFVAQASESLLNICFNFSLSKYGGDIAVGAMTIIISAVQFVMMPIQGLCQGGQPIISYNFGANKVERVKESIMCQFKFCVIYSTLFCIAILAVPQLFVRAFSPDTELVNYTVWALRIYMSGIFAIGFQYSCSQGFVALGKAKQSLLLACLRKIVLLIPLIFILPNFFENKVFAVFLAEPISDILSGVISVVAFFGSLKRILLCGPVKQ